MTIAFSRRSLLGAASAGTAVVLSTSRAVAAPPKLPLFGPAPGVAWLTYNENPYGPSPKAISAMSEAASKGCYYADNAKKRLHAMVAERLGVGHDHLIIGNGSTEVLTAAALDWGRRGAIVCPELFYGDPVNYSEQSGARVVRIPLSADMGYDLASIAAAAAKPGVAMVYLCNPNNPTGMLVDSAALRALVRSVPPTVTVLVDEAYNELTDNPAGNSIVDLAKSGHNVIACRTFSKIYGLAGLRIGYAVSTPENIKRIDANLMTLGLASGSIAAAIASIEDEAFVRFSKSRILEAREMILEATKRLGLRVLPTQANFVFVDVPDADLLRSRMAERNIVIRGAYGKWKNWSRVSTGKIEDVRRYVAALPEALRA